MTSKILRRAYGRISALQALLIIRIHQVALISLCHSPTAETTYPGTLVTACQPKPAHLRFLALSANVKPSFLDYMEDKGGELPLLPPVSQNHLLTQILQQNLSLLVS